MRALASVLVALLALGSTATAQPSFLDDARKDVEERLGVSLRGEDPEVITAPTDEEFVKRHEALTGSRPLDWVLAVAIPAKNVLLVRGSRINTGSNFAGPTLRHEIGHLVLARVARRNGRPLPRWLEEGLCELAAGVVLTREEELELGAAARFGRLEALDELAATFPPHAPQAARAYLVSRAFVEFLDRRAKPEGAKGIVFLVERRESVDEAIAHATGMTPKEAEVEWRRALAANHSVWEALVRSPEVWSSLLGVAAVGAFVAWRIFVRRRRPPVTRRGP